MVMDRLPVCNSQEGVDGKLKSNLEWPNSYYMYLFVNKEYQVTRAVWCFAHLLSSWRIRGYLVNPSYKSFSFKFSKK